MKNKWLKNNFFSIIFLILINNISANPSVAVQKQDFTIEYLSKKITEKISVLEDENLEDKILWYVKLYNIITIWIIKFCLFFINLFNDSNNNISNENQKNNSPQQNNIIQNNTQQSNNLSGNVKQSNNRPNNTTNDSSFKKSNNQTNNIKRLQRSDSLTKLTLDESLKPSATSQNNETEDNEP